MRNLHLKVIALVIAVLLYVFANSQTNASVISLVVPVEVLNLPKNKVILLPEIRQAQVSFKGPSFLIREVAMSAPAFRVSLPKDVSSNQRVALSEQKLHLPPGVHIVSIEPPEIELVLDNLISKQVNIEVPRIGKLQDDFKLSGIQTDPGKVTLVGSETELKNLQSVETMPLDLRDISESTKTHLRLRTLGRFTKASIDSVLVSVDLRKLSLERRFQGVPIAFETDNKLLACNPREANIEVTGVKSKIERLNKANLYAYVKVPPGITKGELPIVVELPEGVELVLIEPERIKIENLKKQ